MDADTTIDNAITLMEANAHKTIDDASEPPSKKQKGEEPTSESPELEVANAESPTELEDLAQAHAGDVVLTKRKKMTKKQAQALADEKAPAVAGDEAALAVDGEQATLAAQKGRPALRTLHEALTRGSLCA